MCLVSVTADIQQGNDSHATQAEPRPRLMRFHMEGEGSFPPFHSPTPNQLSASAEVAQLEAYFSQVAWQHCSIPDLLKLGLGT
jgi:hypothetical protein